MTGRPLGSDLERFGKTTRWFHWSFGSSFLALAVSGTVLGLHERLGLGHEAVRLLVNAHKLFALCLVALPALVWASGETHRNLRDLRRAFRWSRLDLRWLALQPRALFGRATLPRASKFNAGQKINALATVVLTLGLAASGVVLWRQADAVAAWIVHRVLFLMWIPLFVGHIYLAVLNPGTRPALRGMLLGRVPRRWAMHHHPAWVEEVDRERLPRLLGIPAPEEPARRTATKEERLRRVGSFADGEA